MNTRLLLLGATCFCTIILSAQQQQRPQLPDKVEIKLPKLLSEGHPNVDKLNSEFKSGDNSKWGQKRGKTVDRFWIAYSDRSNNQTYMLPNTNSQPCTTLTFGEMVYIAKIDRDMALIYTDTRPEIFPKISDVARSKGWVPMDNLLLWANCPADERGVINKALIAINLNELGQDEQYHGQLYKNPDDHSQPEILSMDMNFYFVMKWSRDGTQALLCRQSTFTGNNLYGWVNKNSFTPWNQRTCLEPNWNTGYVEGHRGFKAYVYQTPRAMDIDGYATYWEFGNEPTENIYDHIFG